MKKLKKYLEDPKIYNIYFPVKNNENIIEKWKNKNNQNFILFREKYSQKFFEFCIKSKLGEKCDERIKISYDIAYLYMSFLANCISRSNGYEIITDEKIYSDFLVHDDLILLKLNKNKISNVYNKISLELPANISDIKLETIINLRKNNDFNNYRRAYIHEIDKILDCKEGNKESSLRDMLTYKKEFLKICGSVIKCTASVIISVFSASSLISGNSEGILSSLASTAMDISTVRDVYREMPTSIENIKTKYLARKYIASLKQLNRSTRIDRYR